MESRIRDYYVKTETDYRHKRRDCRSFTKDGMDSTVSDFLVPNATFHTYCEMTNRSHLYFS